MTTMNAMAVHEFGPAENLIPTKLEVREPAAGEVLVRVEAAAVNPADGGVVRGGYKYPDPVRMPLVPGYDFAGVVETGTEAVPAGTAVIGYTAHSQTQIGSYAEYVTVPERLVVPAPSRLDRAHAAALPLAGLTAQTALHRLALEAGQTLLVNRPTSAIGALVIQIAASEGIDVRTPDDGDESVDAALDVVGADTALAAFARVRDGGKYATIVPEFWIPGGQFTPARGIDPVTVFVDEKVGSLAELARLADAGVLRTSVAEGLPLRAAAEALRRMAAGGSGGRGKLVLLP